MIGKDVRYQGGQGKGGANKKKAGEEASASPIAVSAPDAAGRQGAASGWQKRKAAGGWCCAYVKILLQECEQH